MLVLERPAIQAQGTTRVIVDTPTCYEATKGNRGVYIGLEPSGQWRVIVHEWRAGRKYCVSLDANSPRGAVGMAKTLLSQSVIR